MRWPHVFPYVSFGALVIAFATSEPASARPAASPVPMPFSFDAAPGRLPKDVVPTDYAIAIVPDVATMTLAGTESIALRVRRPTSTIQFNSLGEELANVRFDDQPVAQVVTRDDVQMTTLSLRGPAPSGRHTLTFAYTAKIETAPRGLFAQPYEKPTGGAAGVLLSTQFEATDARRMFPCWDEPAFRATYTLTATVPAAWTALSNMPIASRVEHGPVATTTFARSPVMPSYLVEFSAGDLAGINARSGGTVIGVWAVRGQERDGQLALANAQQILADYNEYFGYPFPLPKLDSIALPGGFQGAMENWGAITYNDQILLLTSSSTMGQRQAIYSVQAHEMAHQWNGDLVTMGWWDDIWLNESFASWRSAKETDLRNPTWNWWEVQDASKEGAMTADARRTSHAIAQHVTDELKALSAFDSRITYAKGQAVLRMLEAYLGPDTFREGIRRYMKARAFSNATATDLWNALGSAAGKDVARVASRWIEQPGFPLVAVTAHCERANQRTIVLSQARFLLNGTDPTNARWDIPMSIRWGAGGGSSLLLPDAGASIAAGACTEPLSVNAGGVGYYRVAYDAPTLALNRQYFSQLPNADKIVILDDQWALVESGAAKLPAYLRLAEAMGENNDARAWEQIAQALETIEHDERGTPGYRAFLGYARKLVQPVARRLGWDPQADEAPDVLALRQRLLADLGAWDDPATVAEAHQRFAAFVADRSAIPPDEQSTVLSIVALDADRATFEALHAIARSARNETEVRRYYGALMNVRDPKLAQAALAIALSAEIPQQAAALRLPLVRAVANYAPQLSWHTFTANVDTLMAPMSGFGPLMLAQSIPEGYWDAVPLPELEAWVKARVPAELAPELSRGMEAAQLSLAEQAALVPAADAYVAASGLRFRAGRK